MMADEGWPAHALKGWRRRLQKLGVARVSLTSGNVIDLDSDCWTTINPDAAQPLDNALKRAADCLAEKARRAEQKAR